MFADIARVTNVRIIILSTKTYSHKRGFIDTLGGKLCSREDKLQLLRKR